MTTALLLLVGIIAILVIIAANGYFVAQEFAFMSVDRSRLGASADAGDAAAARALSVTNRTSFMLSGAQLGITVTGLLIGYVAEPLVGSALGEILGGVGVPAAVGISIGTVAALAISTVVQMIVGELYPKNLAIANAEPMAKGLARSTKIYLAAFGWLITFFDHASNALLKLFRIEPVHDVDSAATPRDLEQIVADSRESGDLPDGLSVMLDRILDFPDRDAEHAMVPHHQVGTVDVHTTIGELRERMAGEHTRYPVLDDEGMAVGLVQLDDLLASDLSHDAKVTDLMREPVLIPTAMALPDALDQLARAGTELACVIDEYGGLAGVLTVEDMAEEVIGEVTDEHDADGPPMVTTESDGVWVIDGNVPVDEVERAVGHDLPEGDYETLAGLLLDVRGDLIDVGESVEIDLPPDPDLLAEDEPLKRIVTAEVVEVERHVPGRVRLRLQTVEADPDHDPTANGGTD